METKKSFKYIGRLTSKPYMETKKSFRYVGRLITLAILSSPLSQNLKFNVGIPATVVCLSLSSFFSSPAYSYSWKEFKSDVVKVADKVAKVADITDPNSDVRKGIKRLDITNPNSPACKTLRSGGDDVSAAAATAGPKGVAVAAAIQTAKKICGNVAQGKAVNSDAAEVDMAVMYQTQLAIEQARLNNDFAKVKLLEDSKFRIEQLQQQGQTDRVKIVQENLLAITLSNNQTAIALGEQNLRAVESNNWALVRQAEINTHAQIVIAQNTNATNLEIANSNNAANVQIAGINSNASTTNTIINAVSEILKPVIAAPQQPPSTASIAYPNCITSNIDCSTGQPLVAPPVATAPSDPAAQLLAQWGWTRIDCRPGVVFITNIASTSVCVNAMEGVPPGEYAYDVASNQLQPLKQPSLPQTIERGNDEDENATSSIDSDQEDSADDVEEFEQDDVEEFEQID